MLLLISIMSFANFVFYPLVVGAIIAVIIEQILRARGDEDVLITKRQREILEGDELKSNEGMLFGSMYADWKKRKGYE